MTRHAYSTIAWVALAVFLAGFYCGAWFGVVTSPAAFDAKVIEKRLRLVFCEQAIKNKLIQTCEAD